MPLSVVARSTGLDENAIERLFANLGEASKMKSPSDECLLHKVVAFRGSQPVSDSFPIGYHPLPPRGLKDANGLMAEFSLDLGRFIQSSRDAVATVEYVVRNMLRDRPCVVFKSPAPDMLGNCLKLYRELGFCQEQMTGISSDETKKEWPTERWLRKWGLSRRWQQRIANQHGPERLLEKSDQWLILEAATPGQQRRGSEQVWKQVLRHVLMAFIRFGCCQPG